MFVALLFSQPVPRGATNTARYGSLLDKGIITQQEYDQDVQEEEREKQATAITKNGLQVKLGGFVEIDFFVDNTRSFQEIIGNRPVLRSHTVGRANSQFQTSVRASLITLDVRAHERDGIKSRFYGSLDFLGNQQAVGPSGTSELTFQTSPDARIYQMYFLVESPAVDVKVVQDWSRF